MCIFARWQQLRARVLKHGSWCVAFVVFATLFVAIGFFSDQPKLHQIRVCVCVCVCVYVDVDVIV